MIRSRFATALRHRVRRWIDRREASRDLDRIVTLESLPERTRDHLVVLQEQVLEGTVHVHRSPSAEPEVATFATEDLRLTLLNDVHVDVYQGFATTPSGLILADTAVSRSAVERKILQGSLQPTTDVLEVDKPLMCLECGPKNANFFHFWFESLTKLLWVREKKVRDQGPSILAYSRDLQPWKQQILAEALPDDVELLQVPRGTSVAAPVYIDLPAYVGTALDPEAIETLRRWAEPLTEGISESGWPSRIAVSRAGAGRRRLLNEDELNEALVARGFTVVELERLEMGEQIRLFQNAHTIVAQHGAGLTHLLHARRGTRLLEIQPSTPDRALPHYRGISVTAGIDYSNVFCNGPDRDTDVTVPLDEVLAWVDRQPHR